MKATGVVRRIDDLGRIVIPKEIRKTLRIKEGDPLEIFTDKDMVIAVSGGSKKEFLEQSISRDLEKIIDDKEVYISKENNDKSIPITQNDNKERITNSQVVYPIISDGDAIGSVILISKDSNTKMSDIEKKVVQSAASFLGSQMEL